MTGVGGALLNPLRRRMTRFKLPILVLLSASHTASSTGSLTRLVMLLLLVLFLNFSSKFVNY